MQRQFIRYPIRLHSKPLIEKEWTEVQDKSSRIIEDVLFRLTCPSDVLRYVDRHHENRKYHLKQLKLMNKALLKLGKANFITPSYPENSSYESI